MADLDKMLSRKEIARRDCRKCGGKGWVGEQGVSEEPCDACGGVGLEEKEVPFDFSRTKPKTPAELASEAFGDPLPENKPVGPGDLNS